MLDVDISTFLENFEEKINVFCGLKCENACMLDNRIFSLVISMVSEGRIYKIVPRKGTKTQLYSLFFLCAEFIKLFPVRGRREP